MAPRTALGATSDMYRIIIALTKPTPTPAIKRPGTSSATEVDVTWRMTPREKMPHPAMIVDRRPIQSAREPAKRAPKNVPAERIETMRDFSHVLYIWPLKALGSVEGPGTSQSTSAAQTCARRAPTSKLLLEEVHSQDAIDVAGIIAKQDASKGREHAEQVATHRDGRLNTADRAAPRGGGRSPDGHCRTRESGNCM
jgi:hypothetical protein